MEIKLIDPIENPEKCIALNYRSIQEILIEATEGSKKDLWHTSDKIPKKNRPLLLQLSNGMLVFGKFEGWGGYSFSIPEPLYKIEIVKWMYIDYE